MLGFAWRVDMATLGGESKPVPEMETRLPSVELSEAVESRRENLSDQPDAATTSLTLQAIGFFWA
jgi:hypothetical protein